MPSETRDHCLKNSCSVLYIAQAIVPNRGTADGELRCSKYKTIVFKESIGKENKIFKVIQISQKTFLSLGLTSKCRL